MTSVRELRMQKEQLEKERDELREKRDELKAEVEELRRIIGLKPEEKRKRNVYLMLGLVAILVFVFLKKRR